MLLKINLIAFKTLVIREVTRFLRIWTQTILPSPITMVLYFVVFGSLIGSRIGTMDGVNYVAFIAPGLIMMAIINNAYANVVGSFFGSKFQRNIEEMYVAPMSSLVILLGFVFGGILRALIVGLLVVLVSLFFTDIHLYHIGVIIVTAFLTALLFALGGMINAIYSQKFDDINIIPTFVLAPLTYLGGVFYSITLLPPFWQKVSYFNPILYMVNAFRYGMLGISDIPVHISLITIALFCVVLFSTCWYLLYKGIGIRS
jgi:ABC-2 type transport system permease protein